MDIILVAQDHYKLPNEIVKMDIVENFVINYKKVYTSMIVCIIFVSQNRIVELNDVGINYISLVSFCKNCSGNVFDEYLTCAFCFDVYLI